MRAGTIRTVLMTLAALALLGLVAGTAVVGFGLYNVSARVGHLPGVSWLLHTTYRNAVRLRAPPEEAVPDLSDPALIALGARHYDSACRFCHAAPGEVQTATARSLVPPPPHIVDAIEGWEPRHLHWIVAEGVKMTGMPHWPAARPGEVWAAVAFLRGIAGMSGADYARLTAPPAGAGEGALGYCAGCHGMDGLGELAPHVPRLDILGEDYLLASLDAYREERRASGFMQHAASRVGPEALRRAAAHYAGESPGPPVGPAPDPALVATGAALAEAETADDDVPACRACHGPEPTETHKVPVPSLSGQHRAYLETQLRRWRAGERGGGARANVMHMVAHDLTDADIAALAAYYASLPPGR